MRPRVLTFRDHAASLLQVLDPREVPTGQPYGWTMDQAVERVSDGAWSTIDRAEWREVAVYLALQFLGSQHRNGERERLAIMNIRAAIAALDEGLAADREMAAAVASLRPDPALTGDLT